MARTLGATLGVVLGLAVFLSTRRVEERGRVRHPPPSPRPPLTARTGQPPVVNPPAGPAPGARQAPVGGPAQAPQTQPPTEPSPPPRPRREGKLSVSASPGYANVFVDGRLRGQTPLEIPLTAGHHSVLIENSHDVTERFSHTVEIREGETTPVQETLSPPQVSEETSHG
jgi:hypothetical protein